VEGAAEDTANVTTVMPKAVVKRIVSVLTFTVIWGAILFGSAGDFRWNRGWICLALTLVCFAASAVLVWMKNPEVAAARSRKGAGVKGFDKVFSAVYTVLLFVVPVVAGFDAVRFSWTSMPFSTVFAGSALYVLGTAPITWAMIVNRFLETQVRIQTDRGHQVVTGGPYRFVRHPMYSGMLLQTLAMPLMLGSWWTFFPVSAIGVAFLWRTRLEDQTLQAELPGYAEFTLQTRYRIVPGVW
jgi:protein-S-isoprenylcysteine O-methyltransferase Ste14